MSQDTMSQDSFHVSPQQEQLWLGEPYGPTGRIQLEVGLQGPLDVARLESALHKTVDRHEILRTTFVPQPGMRVPVQVIHQQLAPSWRTLDLQSMSPEQQSSTLQDAARNELAEPVDFAGGPVVRMLLAARSADRHTLVLTLTALHADVACASPLLDELVRHYHADAEPVEDPLQYADFSAWQRELVGSDEPVAHQARAFWSQFAGATSPSLPFSKEPTGAFAPGVVPTRLAPELAPAIEAQAAAQRTSVQTFVLAAWQALLGRATGEDTVVSGVLGCSPRHGDLVGAIGAFARAMPIRTSVRAELSFAEVLEEVKRCQEEQGQWQDYLPADLGAGLRTGFIGVEPFCTQAGPLTVRLQSVATSGPQFRLWATCQSSSGGLDVMLRFDPRHLEPEQVRRLAGRLERLLQAVAGDGGLTLGEPELLDDEERHQVVVGFNDTSSPIPDVCVHEIIAARAAAAPGRAAVVDQAGSITFAQLESRSNQLANRLRRCGVRPDVPVGLCTDRSIDMIVGLLGILKAGGAYVPLHHGHPAARLAQQLSTADARAIVTQEPLLDRLPEFGGDVVCLDRDRAELDGEPTDAPAVSVSPDNLVYVIYTSGSTGTPKGVGVTHRNLVNYVTDITHRLGADGEPLAFGLLTSISTDLGNTCVFGALCSGGTLVLASQAAAADSALLARQLELTPVDVLKVTPSHIRALLAGEGARVLPQRWLVLGGERLPWDLITRLRELSSVAILNHYGPTEATVGCATVRVGDGPGPFAPTSVPIGRPIANTACYVLDERRHPAPVGVPGTLFVAGAGVARGYVGQVELTDERFHRDPFSSERDAPDASQSRMYDTGDRARWLPDGTIEFLGRSDEQVKIRGYRVEPGEVENALRLHPKVREAVVVTPTNGSGEARLIAYCSASEAVSAEELRGHLASRLPDFMIPSAIALLEQLPRTPSGKVDRLSLPDPATLVEAGAQNYVEPRTPVEEAVAAVWAQMLGADRVGAEDDFFELGGHSLLATHVIAQLRSDFAVDLPLHALFICPTVETLAAEVSRLLDESEAVGESAGPLANDLAPPSAG